MALYTAIFSQRLASLQERMSLGELEDRNYRVLNIHLALKEHLGRYKERPNHDDLYALAEMILNEELTDKHPDKMTREEYAILSDTQVDVREGKQKPHGDLQFGDRRSNGRRKTSFTDDYGAPQVRNNRVIGVHDGEFERLVSYLDLYEALDNAGLTQRQSEAIDLVYFGNMTQEDAAVEMGVIQQAVGQFVRAGLHKLRKYLRTSTSKNVV